MKRLALVMTGIVVVVVLGAATTVLTNPGGTRGTGPRAASTNLRSFEEVPALFSQGSGRFTATLNEAGTELSYELSYLGLASNVTQAHIHFGQTGVNGGIMAFLCTNLGNGPVGTQACPGPDSGTVSGTIDMTTVIGPSGQGITAGEISKMLRIIRAGIAYANVHTTGYPGGEIRGQLTFSND